MRGSAEQSSLRDEHAGGQGKKHDNPADGVGAEELLTENAAAQQRHEDVDKMQVTHGLHGQDANERRHEHDDGGDDELEDGKDGRYDGEAGHDGTSLVLRVVGYQPEDEDGSDCAEQFVPGPLAEEVIAAGG